MLYLVGFKNRVTTVLHWAVSFIGRGRAQRTTTHQQLVGRAALHAMHIPDLSAPPSAGTAVGGEHHEPAAPDRRKGRPAHTLRRPGPIG